MSAVAFRNVIAAAPVGAAAAAPALAAERTLPKGHLSCLSSAFRYTAAAKTDIAQTFARIRLRAALAKPRETPDGSAPPAAGRAASGRGW